MAYLSRLLLVGASAIVCAGAPVQAATYALDFGPTLTGQLTTSAMLTGGGNLVTSVSGTFMGEAITGVVADPFFPDPGHYIGRSGAVRAKDPPGTTTLEYTFDNLLLPGNVFDENGLLFTTTTQVVDLFYYEGAFYADYSDLRTNGPLEEVQLGGSVNAVAEPAVWVLMILGFGLAGSAMRRRRASCMA